MAKGQRLKPEQIVTLLPQIDVLTTNGKTLAQACKEVGTVEQTYYRWRKIYGGMSHRDFLWSKWTRLVSTKI